jgi:hypothetical protein
MLVNKFIEYVMRGRFQAALVALMLSVIPYLGGFATAVMGLVTLRKGAYEGWIIFMWITLPYLLSFAMGNHLQFYWQVFAINLIVWLLAIVLRMTASWSQVLVAGACMAIIAVLVAHAVVDDLPAFWLHFFQRPFDEIKNALILPADQADKMMALRTIAKTATGQLALSVLLLDLGILAVSRWLQARLYNPGGLSKELCNIRLQPMSNVILLLVMTAVFFDITLAWDVVYIVVGMFFLAGLSLFHAMIKRTPYESVGVVVFYAALLLATIFQYGAIAYMIVIMVIIAAIIDSGWNIRARSWPTS